nr:hypothetical protein [Tanacetum cinerariifolium]
MANLSKDIQCAVSDTRPPMLVRTDFASWQQRIRLYCWGKENGVNIFKSIDEGPYQMGTIQEPFSEGTKGAPQLVQNDLKSILACLMKKRIDIWDNVKMLLEGSELTKEDRESQLYDDFEHFRQHKGESTHDYYVWFTKLINDMRNIKMTMSRMQLNSKFVNNKLPEWVQDGRVVVQNVQGRQNRDQEINPLGGGAAGYGGVQNRVGNAQENEVALDAEQLLFLVDEAPTTQTMFMANLSSADPVTDEARPSYDSNILFEVQDHNYYQDAVCAHHEEHAMHDSVQLNHVVDSHTDYTSDSNMIPYDQYVKDNEVPVVHSNVSSIPNNAFMMIYNDMCEPHAQSVSDPSRNTVVENSITAKLATYKEQVKPYERRAKFELTEREQKINEQLRLVISDRNFKEETLKKELHSIKLQLASTINHNKSMVEDRLLKQDQSLQTVHMLCRPKPYYNELNKVVIGYKNPLCLTRAKQVQPDLCIGQEIIKDNCIPAIVHNTKDTLEIVEIIRKKMNDKMKDPECVTRKVKIAPHDYSKENFLATFTPQKQLTPE